MTSGRTPLTQQLRRVLAAHGESERTGIPVDEVLGAADERRTVTRRAVLGAGAALAAGAVLRPRPAAALPANPRIAIVGSGLAGLRAAHWLFTVKGLRSTVYEGNTRIGGRCYTLRDFFPGYTVEHGGAFINTDHNAIRNLVNALGLTLDVAGGGNYGGLPDKYWIGGSEYPIQAANADWSQVYAGLRAAAQSAPYPQTAFSQTSAGVALDNMTVDQWLDANVPGGLSSRFAKLMQSNVQAEYGLDPDQQSALNLIYLLGWNNQNSIDPLTGGDEKYTVRGGNDQIVTRMASQLPAGTVQPDKKLVAVKTNTDGTVRLTFTTGNSTTDVTADRVILALPFSTLRDCDLSKAGFSARKLRAINELGLGANAKIHVELRDRPWVAQGRGGAAYTEQTGFQCAWDDTVSQPRPGGVLNFFTAGSQVINGWTGAPFGAAPHGQVQNFLSQVEPIFPGTKAAYTGRAYRDLWRLNPWSKGAYTCPRPGQYTGLFGIGSLTEGSVHFAGEHTSDEYYGFLEGAVISGERAAKEVALS